MCGCHFHRLYPEYAEICARHGVRLNTRKDVSAAWRSCIARVFELSSPERTPAWALHEPPAAPQRGLASLTEHLPLIVYLATPGVVMLACTPLFYLRTFSCTKQPRFPPVARCWIAGRQLG